MDPGSYIAIADIAFRGACFAVKAFRNGLNYSADAERIVLNLEMERYRLQIWGENSGLVPTDGEEPSLPERLLPIVDVIRRHLDDITDSFQDAETLSGRYGLNETDSLPTTSDKVSRLVERMQRSIRTSGSRFKPSSDQAGRLSGDDFGDLDLADPRRTSTWKRLRWAVNDLKKFDELVISLGERISKLNMLLTESQQQKVREADERVNIVLVDSVLDQASLDLLLNAVKNAPVTSPKRSMVESKALATDLSWSPPPSYTMSPSPLSLSTFVLPEGFETMKRFVTTKTSSESPYLLERKDFDPNITPDDKAKLVQRIQRLVMLLSRPKTCDFRTPWAEGCINDPSRYCWWMVLKLPEAPSPASKASLLPFPPSPVSLHTILQPKAKFRPPLEQRYALASRLCSTLSELYSSSWLHKGIRSDNILFGVHFAPILPSATQTDAILRTMLLCGFDYSRQESEWSTVDKSRLSGEVATALYRHPNYQGDAAQGYKMQYDIYSLGLVLVEIALWVPLSTFLDGKPSSSSTQSRTGDATINLSPNMEVFYAPHAALLKRRVINRVDTELAFRVGSAYYNAVKFCLEFADKQHAIDSFDFPSHPALEFYDNVVTPLSRLAGGSQ